MTTRRRKKIKVRTKTAVGLKHRGDTLGVDTTGLKKAPTKVPNNGITFKIKVKKKGTSHDEPKE